jgi:ferredoxin-NADP reductase
MQAASAASAPLPAFVRFRGAAIAPATAPKAQSDASNTIVMTCGPPSLMESASNAALSAGFLFHSEAFEI